MEESLFQTIQGISFGRYSTEEIKKLSALEIIQPEVLDILGHPTTDGLHDLRLGPNDRDDYCGSCGLGYFHCPGHPGHITLPVCVYNPVLFSRLYQLLRGMCFNCHRLLARPHALNLTLYQLQALDYGLVSTVQDLAEVVSNAFQDSALALDNDAIKLKLKKKFEEAIKDSGSEEKHPVKSVVECRRSVIKQFVKENMMGATGKCPHCHAPRKKFTRYQMRIVYTESKKSAGKLPEDAPSSELANKELTAEEAKKDLHLLWQNDKVFLSHLYKVMCEEEQGGSIPIDIFFMSVLLVPPSKFRRLSVMKGRKFADTQTITYSDIIKSCQKMNKILKKVKNIEMSAADLDEVNKLQGKTDAEKFNLVYQQLQRLVNEIFDSDSTNSRDKKSSAAKGIKQILEKKEGLLRMNMMGKRVNFAARSVISPDPYINVNEIGIPMVFAKKLTFPEPVNQWNFERMRRAVANGPSVHPGATLVQMEDGSTIKLSADEPVRRKAIANTLLTPQPSAIKVLGGVKVVHRHLKDGDMLLLNRQPTLHKPSIMAHKARVLPGEKTLRLHYSNCKSYNADFDGDEMNAHFPQCLLGQSESRNIVNVNHQYLVPKDGTPLGGLIQDHIIAAVKLTVRGRFFNKEDYQQLIYSAISFVRKRIKILPPAILKPEPLWSGKQIISSIIINLIPEGKIPPSIVGKSKVSSKNWVSAPAREWVAGGTPFTGETMSEAEVIVSHGELLCGIIDKAQIGPTPYSLIHMCYELYGGETSSVLLTALARLFTHFLQYHVGFSLGIEDIAVNPKANKKRRKVLNKAAAGGLIASARALDVAGTDKLDIDELITKYRDAHHNRDDFGLKMLDMEMKNVTHSLNNNINDVCIPKGLRKKFPQNNLQLMVESGAKGSSVNAMQISCLLGQIELEGRRMPLMLNGSTLPSFKPYCTSPGAGGFVGGRFLTGINPQEYFFHCMAGREGLIDTAVKTSRSGYLQRCLIKHLEGITVNYDLTVRDSDGTVIQFLYGEDGMDPLKMQLLKEKSFHLLAKNYDAAANENEIEYLQNSLEVNLAKEKKKIRKWKKKHPEKHKTWNTIIKGVGSEQISGNPKERVRQLFNISSMIKEEYEDDAVSSKDLCPDPVNSRFRPDTNFGAVCEQMDSLISDYCSKNPQVFSDSSKPGCISKNNFKKLCYYRSIKSLVEPGESVGLLAAQSVGEPSTQMTLNTFHFAGKGEMNVTLGIPRIREILMTASPNIATPTMDLPFRDIPNIEQKAEKLKSKLSPVKLSEVLKDVKIKEFLSINNDARSNSRNYIIRLNFLKYSTYKGYIATTPSKILYYIEHIFIKRLIEIVRKKMKLSVTSRSTRVIRESAATSFKSETMEADVDDAPAEPSSSAPVNDGESSAESDDEGDTTSAKSKMQHNQELEYEEPEEDELVPESNDENEDVDDKEDVKIKKELLSEAENEAEDVPSPVKILRHKIITEEEKSRRINYVKCINSLISDYNFDSVSERWCEISLQFMLNSNRLDMKTILEEEIARCNVHSVPNIKEAIIVKGSDGKSMLKTNGVNFLEVFKHVDILDVNKAYSNNIHEIATIYGIEAASRAIQKEVVGVFGAYGIEVDSRHLSLISDYMTCSGVYRPFSRLGMEGNASPLQQMTFETTTNFMVDAMLMGVEDRVKSPSANIIAGKLIKAGTGAFDLLVRINSLNTLK